MYNHSKENKKEMATKKSASPKKNVKKTTTKKTATKKTASTNYKAKKIYELILKDGSHHFTSKESFNSFKLKTNEMISFETFNGSFVGEMFISKENIHCFVVYEEQNIGMHNKELSFLKHK